MSQGVFQIKALALLCDSSPIKQNSVTVMLSRLKFIHLFKDLSRHQNLHVLLWDHKCGIGLAGRGLNKTHGKGSVWSSVCIFA